MSPYVRGDGREDICLSDTGRRLFFGVFTGVRDRFNDYSRVSKIIQADDQAKAREKA